ncbi:MAG TPA: DUF5317 family protein [bacterium]|nr:DUF5317 family protein [bacterium]
MLAVLAGLAAGRLRGGRLVNVTRLNPRWLPMLVLGVAAVAAARGAVLPVAAARACVVGGYLFALAALLVNLKIPWLWLALTGGALNAVVIAANGGRMPVSAAVLRVVSRSLVLGGATGPFYVLAGPGTALAPLGDTLPLVVGGAGVVLSPGDILLAAGIATTLQAAMVVRAEAPQPGVSSPGDPSRGNGDRPG